MTQLVSLWLAIPEPIRDALWPSIIWTQEEAEQEETRRARRATWEDAIMSYYRKLWI
jgi:hypothetical protein